MKQKVDKLAVAREWRGGECGLTVKGYELSFWNGENALKLHMMVAQSRACTKNHLIIHVKG